MHLHNYTGGGTGLILEGKLIARNVQAVTFAGQMPLTFTERYWEEGRPGGWDPHERVKDLNSEGISTAVLYPSMCGILGGVKDPELAEAMARAYNNWLADYCRPYPTRLFGVAVLPYQDTRSAIVELRRTVKELKFKALMVRPNQYYGRTLDHPYFEPLWQEAQALGVAVGFHPFPFHDLNGVQDIIPDVYGVQRSAIMMADAACLPMDNMLTMAYLMFGGVLDRHPKLRVAFLESNGSWAAMWMYRLDKRFERQQFPALKTRPTEIVARQCYIALDGDERPLPNVVDLIGEDRIVWASDYPHFDGKFPGAVEEAEEHIAGLPERVQRKFLGENAAKLYNLSPA